MDKLKNGLYAKSNNQQTQAVTTGAANAFAVNDIILDYKSDLCRCGLPGIAPLPISIGKDSATQCFLW